MDFGAFVGDPNAVCARSQAFPSHVKSDDAFSFHLAALFRWLSAFFAFFFSLILFSIQHTSAGTEGRLSSSSDPRCSQADMRISRADYASLRRRGDALVSSLRAPPNRFGEPTSRSAGPSGDGSRVSFVFCVPPGFAP
jgi:hypothetical protein